MFKEYVIFVCVLVLLNGYKVSDFKPSILKPSPPSGFHNVDTGDDI